MRSLDDFELAAYARAVLFGDGAVEADLAVPTVRVGARTAETEAADAGETPVATGEPVPEPLLLDGEWLLAGSVPQKQFSIERWAEPAGSKPPHEPAEWFRPDTDRSAWTPATVPGTVQGALAAAGVTPHPLLGSATYDELVDHGVPEHWPWHFRRTRIEQQEWWYARRFTVPASWEGRRIRLAFDGVDYSATVYLDGSPVARHEGMFGGPEIDVTALIAPGAEHELVVRFDPPPHDWHGVLKGSPGWGWHYGHLISIGLWRSVRLEVVPEVELAHPFVSTVRADADSALLRVRADVRDHTDARGTLSGTVTVRGDDGVVVASRSFELAFTGALTRFELELELDRPRLWWPFGYGEQPLHRVEIEIGGHAVEVETGIRTIEMEALPDWQGEEFYRWRFVVNGRPMFLTGANWCWTDPLTERDGSVDEHLLRLTRHAGLRMLRAWGGGIVESERFYAACDRLGILVLQEFPFCFGLPGASSVSLAAVDQQVTRIVRALRNHPSLIVWGGGNENELTRSGDELLLLAGRRTTALDDSRPFHRTDPWGGSVHSYTVYHEGARIDEGYTAVDGAVWGEYGLSSQCALESMAEFLDPALLEEWPPPAHGAILQHQAQFSLVDIVKQLRYADYGPIADWATFIEASQVAQGEALRFASERARSGSGDHTSAYWLYKLGEVFPGASWAIADFYGRPKRSFYLARSFSRPRSVFAVTNRLDWAPGELFKAEVHLANDTPEPLDASVEARLWDADLTVAASWSGPVSVAPDQRVLAHRFSTVVPGRAHPLHLEVRMTDARGETTSQWYWFNARQRGERIEELERSAPDELWEADLSPHFAAYAADRPAPLWELPRTRLAARAVDGGFEVQNVGEVPAPLVLVDGFPHGPGALLHDDAFGLAPGETRVVGMEGEVSVASLSVRAWNADAVGVTA
ncbi:glycoside hydrolase family 2 TIM barrel-domain containing protein [Herbiconiux sp. KACC 21604]|uniref:glycoside hydrolase family 2 protein n=1 Tax=unclassified Herbiconiux TaxID=2618217 RepID=UPI001491C9B1|nr:sugar-binding domain-containing protein [Herbiconiux sp. SALV-R1]QJU55748.1 hypothetical protein HL652_20425 [Herbiconiux sp. SALV-R1]WPO86956.1 glycoside hydrolase family 2 TIM barrel-domain containing protein [Herbiconiux sp. KACC 21604]